MRPYTKFLKIYLSNFATEVAVTNEAEFNLLELFESVLEQEEQPSNKTEVITIKPLPHTTLEITGSIVEVKYRPDTKFKPEDIQKLNDLPDVVTVKFEDGSSIHISRDSLIDKISYLQASAKHVNNLLQKTKSIFAKVMAKIISETKVFKDNSDVTENIYVAHAALMEKTKIKQESSEYGYMFGYIDGLLEMNAFIVTENQQENVSQEENTSQQETEDEKKKQNSEQKSAKIANKIASLSTQISELAFKARNEVGRKIANKITEIVNKLQNAQIPESVKLAIYAFLLFVGHLIIAFVNLITALFTGIVAALQLVVQTIVSLISVTVDVIVKAATSARTGLRELFDDLKEAWAKIIKLPTNVIDRVIEKLKKQPKTEATVAQEFIVDLGTAKLIAIGAASTAIVVVLMSLFKAIGFGKYAKIIGVGGIFVAAAVILLLYLWKPTLFASEPASVGVVAVTGFNAYEFGNIMLTIALVIAVVYTVAKFLG